MTRGNIASHIVGTLAVVLLTGSAHAHLSIIRQGFECAGANEVGDQHGYSVAAGDFNGDGIDDLAMGAIHEDVGGVGNAGAVIVSWGSVFGITHLGSIAYTASDMTDTEEASALVGYALAGGDFNGDGIDDLAVSAPFKDGADTDTGVIYIMRGSPTGLQPWGILDQADLGWPADRSDHFGWSLAAGNFNLDGYDDLAIGCPGLDLDSGMAFYAMGSVIGPFSGGFLNRSMMGFGVSQPGDRFGWDVAIGNITGDAFPELIVSAPWEDSATGLQDFGRVYVVGGAEGGPLDMPASLQIWAPDGPAHGANFGWAVDAGNVLGQSYEALAVGEPFRTVQGKANAGRVCVLPGDTNQLNLAGTLYVTQDMSGWPVEGDEHFGKAVEIGYVWDPADGYEDLVVGGPSESFNGVIGSAGEISLLFGGPSGPTGAHGWYGFAQWNLNEAAEPVDQLGFSLCVGNFDGTGFGNIATGAPGEDSYAGLVHVIAPWRQVYNLSAKRSVAYDCEHNLIFSQKPFDSVKIASTTKIMTVLIACERSQLPSNDPMYVDLQTTYTVPSWVADLIPGSQVPLITGEWMTLEDLMYTCLMLSGNDAANAIGDLLWGGGGPNISLPFFIQEMNDRAAALGMGNTHFHNPAGLDHEPVGPELGEHYSTPYDMGTLSRKAMDNPLFAQIAGTVSRNVTRHVFGQDFPFMVNNFFTGVLTSNIAPMTGIKGGWTPGAKSTGCFSGVESTGQTAIAGTYTTPDAVNTNYVPDAGALIQLALGVGCNFFFQLPDEYDYSSSFGLAGVPAGFGQWLGGGANNPQGDADDHAFSFVRTDGNDFSATVRACLTHTAELLQSDPGDRLIFGVQPFSEHDAIKIMNRSDEWTAFSVETPEGGQSYEVGPGETIVLPAFDQPMAEFQWSISNETGEPLHLDVEETYWYDVTALAGTGPSPAFTMILTRDEATQTDGFMWLTEGRSEEGGEFYLLGHDPDDTTVSTPDVGHDDPAISTEPITLRAPVPNPFQQSTRIGFDLRVGGDISVDIFDVAGRRVRQFPAQSIEAGAWGVLWDGTNDSGRRVARGSYFYQVYIDGRPAAGGKLTLVR